MTNRPPGTDPAASRKVPGTPFARWTTIIVVSCFAVALASPCLSAAKPVKIGVTLGLSGRFAAMSDALRSGFRLWEKDVNQRNGLLGRPRHRDDPR
jgi:ABC-type branched-subunit amino acid transport system substrate-binding protein